MDNVNVLVDRLAGERTLSRDILWVVGFSLLTGLMAQIAIPLPFTPVPITGQTFAVLLSGAVLGSRRGFACQVLYLAEGLSGLAVFAPLPHLLGLTGGYLLSYPVAAGVVGLLVELGASRKIWRLAAALALGDLLILTIGTAWLRAVLHLSIKTAWFEGFYPFLIGDALKIAFVGISLPITLKRFRSPDRESMSS